MEPKNLIMTSDLYVRLDYDDLKDKLKRKMSTDNNYFKGYLDNEESMLYYRSDFLTIPGFSKIPVTQLTFKKTNDLSVSGGTKIRFRIITPLLIIFALSIATLWILYLLDIDGLRTSDNGIIIPILGTIFFYGIPLVRYLIELSYFRNELNGLD
jgi:hypothetical protein